MNESAYPLLWPIGWPRTKYPSRSRFGRSSYVKPTVAFSCKDLSHQLNLLYVKTPILSTNIVLNLDGQPRSNQIEPRDSGVALYFTLSGKRIALACDKWDKVGCNIMALAKHIEAIRGQDRWGVGRLEQAFAGYQALMAPGVSTCWWEVLGLNENANVIQIEDAYKELAKIRHPDLGGTNEKMAELNQAREMGLEWTRR